MSTESSSSSGPANGPPLQIGSYRIVHPLGSGGMSSVFLARHVETGHEVALKVLPRSLAKNPTLLQRFMREAKTAEALEHPHIVAIFDRGSEQGRYYLVLELVPGGDLHDLVRTRGPLSVEQTIQIAVGVARGLDHAAQRGLIHRDIKPANILLAADGSAKVADLGLAVQLDEEDERVTRDGTTVGTVDYMAPEQARDSRATSVRSDIYSLGCTLFHLLTGAAPFAGGAVADKLRRHALEAAPDVRTQRPDVPPRLATILQRMMAKKPDARFATYDQLIEALLAVPLGPASHETPAVALLDDDPGGGPLEAVIDDDDTDLPGLLGPAASAGGTTTEATAHRSSGTAPTAPLAAILDDDIELAPIPPGGEAPRPGRAPRPEAPSSPRPPRPRGPETSRAELDLSALAELEPGGPPATKPRGAPTARPDRAPAAAPVHDDDHHEPSAPVLARAAGPGGGFGGGNEDLRLWITRGLMVGLFVVALGYLASVALRGPGTSEPAPDEPIAAADGAEAEATSSGEDTAETSTREGSVPGTVTSTEPLPPAIPEPPIPSWTEPQETEPGRRAEPALRAGLLAGFLPDWARLADPDVAAPVVAVRRLPGPSSGSGNAIPFTIAEAVAGPAGTIEIRDDGPFFETEGRLGERPRILRAAAGYRPIVVLGPAPAADAQTADALLDLDGQDVTIEGLHLVVDLARLPARVTSVFSCPGGTLTLRNCTVTLAGQADRPIALARVGSNDPEAVLRPARLRLDRTWVQALGSPVVRFEGAGSVLVERSVLIAGRAPVVEAIRPAPGTLREVVLVRSLALSEAAVVHSVSTTTLSFRPLESALVRIASPDPETPGPAALVVLRGEPTAGLPAALNWSGQGNLFRGWPAWLDVETGGRRNTSLPSLEAARGVWPNHEARSQEETATAIPLAGAPWSDPSAVLGRVQDLGPLAAALESAAKPPPHLEPRTIGRFEPVATGPASVAPPPPSPTVQHLTYNTAVGNGDLGRFLAAQLPRHVGRTLVVQVQGKGEFAFSPCRVPRGTHLWVEAPPAPGTGGAPPVTWKASPAPGNTTPMIDAQYAQLTLRNVQITRPAEAGPSPLIRVRDGHLDLAGCRLLGGAASGGSSPAPLVEVLGPTTRPIAVAGSVAGPGQDRTVARLSRTVLVASDVAIRAELGRGLVMLDRCAVAGAGTLFDLVPAHCRRDRLDAGLQLSACTLVSGGDFVRVGAWHGQEPGPDRPWLVFSRNCAFLAGMRGQPVAVVNPADHALDRGVLAWQSDQDVYDVGLFLRTLASAPQRLRNNLQRDWVDFWGPAHIGTVLAGARVRLAGSIASADKDPATLALVPNGALPFAVGAPPDVVGFVAAPPPAAPGPPGRAAQVEGATPAPGKAVPKKGKAMLRPGAQPF